MFSRFFTSLTGFICLAFMMSISAFAADPYTVADVAVDASAGNALEAQTKAVSDGQLRAANIIIERLTLASERAAKGFRGINAQDSALLIRALEIANEKRSANRYLGDITVAFNRQAVASFLRTKGLTLVDTQSRKRLVIPSLDGESIFTNNAFSKSLMAANLEHALTPMQSLTRRSEAYAAAGSGMVSDLNIARLKVLGQVYGVQQVLIAEAVRTSAGLRVKLTDYALDSGEKRSLGSVSAYNANDAVAKLVAKVEEDWKKSTATQTSGKSVTMPVSVLYRSHAEWMQIQDVINGSAQIRSARLEAFSKSGALMFLTYAGDISRLRNELAYKGMSLKQDDKLGMVLSRTGAF